MQKIVKIAKRTVSYLRTSTDDQVQCGTVETQRDEILIYCKRQDLSVDDWYSDDGVSGAIPIADRRDGGRLMADVARGIVGTVLLYRLDRLGREDYDILATAAELRRFGVSLVSVTEWLGDDTPSGRMQIGVLAVFAAHERRVFRQRSMDGRRRCVREGGWAGGQTPFGYMVLREDERDHAHLLPSPSKAHLALRLFEQYAEGRPLRDLANWLQAMGVTAPRGGKKWQASTVTRILHSPVYRGEYRHGVETCQVPALVSEELWGRVQERMAKNLTQRSLWRENPYTLTGYLTCYHCGFAYVGGVTRPATGGVYRYYHCNQYAHRAPGQSICPGRKIACEEVESRVLGWLRDTLDDGMTALLHVQEARIREVEETPDRTPYLRAQLEAIADQRQVAIGLRTDGIITEGDLLKQMERLEERRRTLAEELEIATMASARAARIEADFAELVKGLTAAEEFLRGTRDPAPDELRGLVETLKLRVAVETQSINRKRARFPLRIRLIGSDVANTVVIATSLPILEVAVAA